jgi:DNA-binding SARP family transcriptional activator/Tol biopolymer transport system component
MPTIEFRALGTLELRGPDGRELYSLLAQPKQIALLAYLSIAKPRGFHHRDTLLGLFWPNVDQDHARTSLRRSLYILRRALGEDAIVSRGDEEVAVDFEHLSCDVVAFDDKMRANLLDEALELYRGDLLAGFYIDEAPEFERWLQSERSRLRSSAARAAYLLSDRLDATGEVGAAFDMARRSFELADADESGFRKLIELQSRTGDRTGAIRAYEIFAQRLTKEFQTEPSAETRALVERIRSGAQRTAHGEREVSTPYAEREPAQNDSPTAISPAPRATSGFRVGPRVRNAAYVAAALAILIYASAKSMRSGGSNRVLRYTLALDTAETITPGDTWAGRIALSPDGSRLAYIGGPHAQVMVRLFDQLHAVAIPGTEGASTPFFSPDGQHLGFVADGKRLEIVALSGGAPIIVADTIIGIAGEAWGSDSVIYCDAQPVGGLLRVDAKAGAIPRWFTVLDTAQGETDHSFPDVLPNGKGVLFTIVSGGKNAAKGTTPFAIAVAAIPSGKHRVLIRDAVYARYAASGHLLYVTTNGTLMRVPFDQSSMSTTGKPTPLIEGMRVATGGSTDLAISDEGTLVYATNTRPGSELVWVTRDGKVQPVDSDSLNGELSSPALSPDGKEVALTRNAVGEKADIWIKRLDRGSNYKLTLGGNDNYGAGWTPDGRFVTFSSDSGTGILLTQRADGSDQSALQVHEKSDLYNPRWSPDGKWLVFQTDVTSPGVADIKGIRPGVDLAAVPLVASRFSDMAPAISPNGKWLAYASDETGRFEIYVVPFPNTTATKWAVSSGGGAEPLWSHQGTELFYRDRSRYLVAVAIKPAPTFSLGRSARLFPTGAFTSAEWGREYDVSPDDKRFLMIRPAPDNLIVVKNWFEELKAKSQR